MGTQTKRLLVGLNSDYEDRVLPPGDSRKIQNLRVGSSDDDNLGVSLYPVLQARKKS